MRWLFHLAFHTVASVGDLCKSHLRNFVKWVKTNVTGYIRDLSTLQDIDLYRKDVFLKNFLFSNPRTSFIKSEVTKKIVHVHVFALLMTKLKIVAIDCTLF